MRPQSRGSGAERGIFSLYADEARFLHDLPYFHIAGSHCDLLLHSPWLLKLLLPLQQVSDSRLTRSSSSFMFSNWLAAVSPASDASAASPSPQERRPSQGPVEVTDDEEGIPTTLVTSLENYVYRASKKS